MEDIVDVESELTQRLSGLQKRLEKVAHPDLSHRGDLAKVHELIKANLQRSKVIQDQVNESKVGIFFLTFNSIASNIKTSQYVAILELLNFYMSFSDTCARAFWTQKQSCRNNQQICEQTAGEEARYKVIANMHS